MSITQVVGVDPGLVHTGVVSLMFWSTAHRMDIEHIVIDGPNAGLVASWVNAQSTAHRRVFVEAYKTRQNLSSDTRMVQLEHELRVSLPSARFLPNMGIKRVISSDLMRLLEVWTFPTATHHHDLRAAARIALLGMVKDAEMNRVLADVVRANLDGRPWSVAHV